MINKTTMMGSLVTLALLFGLVAGGAAIAQETHEGMSHSNAGKTGEFQRIEQPLWVKGAVTVGGLGLISLELWWFLLSKPKLR